MTVQTVTSGKAQSNFGQIAEIVKFGEPVTITQYGRPTMMLIRYQDGVEALRELAKRRLINWMEKRSEELPASAASLTEEELNAIIHEERNK